MNEKALERLDEISELTQIMTDFMKDMGKKLDPMAHFKGAAE